ncbi:MAG: hypothetical protein MJ076_00585 [Clostridia bacterium]|nr:hypothetical protein [Clostridia bacterium]
MAIYNGTVIKTAYKGDYGPCQIYKGTKKYAGFTNYIYTGQRITITRTYNDILNLTIYGATYQSITPSHNNPSSVDMVGDLVTDVSDINYGRYNIPIIVNSIRYHTFLDKPLCANKSSVYDEFDISTGIITRRMAQADMKNFLTSFISEFETSAIEPENLRIVIPNECFTYERFGGYQLPIEPSSSGVNTLGYSNRYVTSASYQQQPAFVVIPPNPNIYFYYDANALGLTTSSTKTQVKNAIINWLGTIDEFFLTYQVKTPSTETTQGVTLRTQPQETKVLLGCRNAAVITGKIKRIIV